jgi:hypothetical protein
MATYREIQDALKAEIPAEFLRTRQQGGQTLTFMPWHACSALADERAPGWSGYVERIQQIGDAVAVTYRISIPTDDGVVEREAIGYESLATSSYGDPTSNAESMAFRRAWAKHGLGSSLYGQEKVVGQAPARAFSTPVAGAPVPVSSGSWNGMLWYGSTKGKHFTDPTVDVKSLQWGADNARNRDGSPNEEQRAVLRDEIARRKGTSTEAVAPVAAPVVAPVHVAPASIPAANNDKVGSEDLTKLMAAAKASGKKWTEVKALISEQFGKEPSALTRDEFDLTLAELA